jgi:hypothetical protein
MMNRRMLVTRVVEGVVTREENATGTVECSHPFGKFTCLNGEVVKGRSAHCVKVIYEASTPQSLERFPE